MIFELIILFLKRKKKSQIKKNRFGRPREMLCSQETACKWALNQPSPDRKGRQTSNWPSASGRGLALLASVLCLALWFKSKHPRICSSSSSAGLLSLTRWFLKKTFQTSSPKNLLIFQSFLSPRYSPYRHPSDINPQAKPSWRAPKELYSVMTKLLNPGWDHRNHQNSLAMGPTWDPRSHQHFLALPNNLNKINCWAMAQKHRVAHK